MKTILRIILFAIVSFLISKIDIPALNYWTAECLTLHPLVQHSTFRGEELLFVRNFFNDNIVSVAKITGACTFFGILIGSLCLFPIKKILPNIIPMIIIVFAVNFTRLLITLSIASVGVKWAWAHDPTELVATVFILISALILANSQKLRKDLNSVQPTI